MRHWMVLLAVLIVVIAGACRSRNAVAVPVAPNDNDYVDLAAGGTVTVNVPLLKSGGYVAKGETVGESGTTLTVSMPDLIGFRVSKYEVQGKADGRVRLKFDSATVTSDGKMVVERRAPVLPFELPPGGWHVRFIFTVRSSQADHNMAIVAAKDLGELNGFTQNFRVDPKVCEKGRAVFCVWVPAGIAILSE